MESRVVLITGALTGIGRATALAFARKGAKVVVSGRRADAGEALAAEIRALGAEALFVAADVRHERDVRVLVDEAVSRFGRLDVAVNNAGTEGRPGPLTEQSAETYAATFDTNVLGVGASLYVASKHAVEGLTKSAALEGAAFGVRVNAVAPGPVDTGMLDRFVGGPENKAGMLARVPLGRLGAPDDIAAAIVYLASPEASFVSGQILGVNGGITAG